MKLRKRESKKTVGTRIKAILQKIIVKNKIGSKRNYQITYAKWMRLIDWRKLRECVWEAEEIRNGSFL